MYRNSHTHTHIGTMSLIDLSKSITKRIPTYENHIIFFIELFDGPQSEIILLLKNILVLYILYRSLDSTISIIVKKTIIDKCWLWVLSFRNSSSNFQIENFLHTFTKMEKKKLSLSLSSSLPIENQKSKLKSEKHTDP